MTGHFREAERLIDRAATWEDADHGWRAGMSTRERVDRAKADYLGAIAHAVTGLLEALTPPNPLDLADDPAASTRVPVLDVPMRTDTRKEEP